MKRQRLNLRLVATAALTAVIAASLAGIALARPPWAHPSSAQYQYGPAGKQYGPAAVQYGVRAQGVGKVTICHKGWRTIKIGVPAWKAHQAHGDTSGACGASAAHPGKAKGLHK